MLQMYQMKYVVRGITDSSKGYFDIVNIEHIDGCMYLKVEDVVGTRLLVNVEHISFGANRVGGNRSTYSIAQAFVIDDKLSRQEYIPISSIVNTNTDDGQKYTYITSIGTDYVTLVPMARHHVTGVLHKIGEPCSVVNVQVKDISFYEPHGSYFKLHGYQQDWIVWRKIRYNYLLGSCIGIIVDVQKLIKCYYVLLINECLDYSFKLF